MLLPHLALSVSSFFFLEAFFFSLTRARAWDGVSFSSDKDPGVRIAARVEEVLRGF